MMVIIACAGSGSGVRSSRTANRDTRRSGIQVRRPRHQVASGIEQYNANPSAYTVRAIRADGTYRGNDGERKRPRASQIFTDTAGRRVVAATRPASFFSGNRSIAQTSRANTRARNARDAAAARRASNRLRGRG